MYKSETRTIEAMLHFPVTPLTPGNSCQQKLSARPISGWRSTPMVSGPAPLP